MEEQTILTLDGVGFTEQELKAILMAKLYVGQLEVFGAPDHLYLVTLSKLAKLVEKKCQFRSAFWSSE